MRMTSGVMKSFLESEPRFDDIMCSLRATGRQPKGIIREMKQVVAIARRFNEEVARPYVAALDLKMHEDPDYLPWDFVKKSNEWGFYHMFIPRIFGGKGFNLSCVGVFMEEIGSVCAAMANLIGVHYLGYIALVSSWHMRLIDEISRDVARGGETGEPCLISFAMTEPDAGTDSQNVEFMDTGSLACQADKKDGGYVVNGTKIFISNGHLSTWHMLFAYTDLQKASENMVMLAVKTGAQGFSFGKKEKKMGQKASIASELVFRDCFVPEAYVLLDNEQTAGLSKGPRDIVEQILANIWAVSRMGVCAFGTGAARGAFERAVRFATETEVNGDLLINHEWCQSHLAEMYKNVAVARLTYMESAYTNGMDGAAKPLNFKPLYYMTKYTPAWVFDKLYSPVLKFRFVTWLIRKFSFDFQKCEEINRIDGWGSLAKVVGTDAGVTNGRMALEIMGNAGVRHDYLTEKTLRDAKLYQIYEGTNQINRINLFKRLVAPNCSDAETFCQYNQ
ncbi:MAG: acyl-CoA dehydrogenase family protein [Thermodesulfobacteriota bacterium]|nr:acyl-CoA dehydrogenase family protein [Thermodesulfobacteriota bacterium]